jgi:hypothetical protein
MGKIAPRSGEADLLSAGADLLPACSASRVTWRARSGCSSGGGSFSSWSRFFSRTCSEGVPVSAMPVPSSRVTPNLSAPTINRLAGRSASAELSANAQNRRR